MHASFIPGHHHIIGTNLTRTSADCQCNKDTEDDGECDTLGMDPRRTAHAKYWCFVDQDSECADKKESTISEGKFYSFQACASNCFKNILSVSIKTVQAVQDPLL